MDVPLHGNGHTSNLQSSINPQPSLRLEKTARTSCPAKKLLFFLNFLEMSFKTGNDKGLFSSSKTSTLSGEQSEWSPIVRNLRAPWKIQEIEWIEGETNTEEEPCQFLVRNPSGVPGM